MKGERLKQIRIVRGYTQEELSSLLNIGNAQIWRYENEVTEPSSTVTAAIARALDVSADYLLGLSDDPQPNMGFSDLSVREKMIVIALRAGEKYEAVELIVKGEAQ